jgi:uncharacterized protein
MRPSRSEVLRLLAELNLSPDVISHSKKVASVAQDLGRRVAGNGNDVDLWLLETGSLVHDIGRVRTHSIRHGIEGADMIRKVPACLGLFGPGERDLLTRICERHIGGGIPSDHAGTVGLPPRDYVPTSVEEKIIAHADNLVWNGVLTLEESIKAFERRFGRDSPILIRIVDLGAEVERMAGGENEGNHDSGENIPKSS